MNKTISRKVLYLINLDYNFDLEIQELTVLKETMNVYYCNCSRMLKKDNEDKVIDYQSGAKMIFGQDKNKIFDIIKDDVKNKIKQLQEFVEKNESEEMKR